MTSTADAPKRNRALNAPARIKDYLAAHPRRRFRPAEIARATGLTTQQVANSINRLAAQGKVARYRNPDHANGPGSSTYGHAGPRRKGKRIM